MDMDYLFFNNDKNIRKLGCSDVCMTECTKITGFYTLVF